MARPASSPSRLPPSSGGEGARAPAGPATRVAFSVAAAPGSEVSLVGDFPTWARPISAPEVARGEYLVELDLEPGVYRYRFRVARDLVTPPGAPLDVADGYENAEQVVAGASRPLVFAPDRAHVVRHSDGTLIVHAELGAGAAVPTGLVVGLPGGALVRAPVERAPGWGDRVPLRAEVALPVDDDAGASDDGGWFAFEGYPADVFPLPPPRAPTAEAPAWLDGAVLYGVFLDRWRRGGPAEPTLAAAGARSTPGTRYGGDLEGVTASLDELKALGVDGVVLTPLHVSPTPHRYDGLDLLTIDPALGGGAALKRLIDAAWATGIKIIVDLSVTHVSVGHPFFQDVLEKQERSRFCDWFVGLRFPVEAFRHGCYAWFYDRSDLVRLNLEHPPAREHALEAARRLVESGVDGLRLDAMDDAPATFWAELRARVRAKNPRLCLLGEIVSDRPARQGAEAGVDTATDFVHLEALKAFLVKREVGARGFWERCRRHQHRVGPLGDGFFLRFLDNHDTSRLLTLAGPGDRGLALWRAALCWLYFQPGPVWLTYGSEHDLASYEPSWEKLDDAWHDRLPMPAGPGAGPTANLLARLAEARRALEGPLELIDAEGECLVVARRRRDGGRALLVLNAGEEAVPAPAGRLLVSSAGGGGAEVPPRSSWWAVVEPT